MLLFYSTDQNAMIFQGGRHVEYKFQRKVQVQEAYVNLAFKTSQPNGLVFQLHGLTNAHVTVVMQAGVLKVLYNFDSVETDTQSIQFKHPSAMGRFDDNQRHIIRVHHKQNQMYAYVLDDNNNPLSAVRNISGPTVETSLFPEPTSLSIGKYTLVIPGIPTTFSGCISGLRYHYLPQNARVGVNIDIKHLLVTKNANLIPSTPPPTNGSCGPMLPIPPPLPPIIAPQQFRFRNPVITVAPIGSQFTFAKVIVVIVIIVLAIFAIVLFFVTLNYVEKHRKRYKKKEDQLRLMMREQPMAATSTQPYRNFEPEPEPEIHLRELAPQSTEAGYPAQPSYAPNGNSYAPSSQPVAASPPEKDEDDSFFL